MSYFRRVGTPPFDPIVRMMRPRLYLAAVVGSAVLVPTALSAQQGRDEATFAYSRQLSAGGTVVVRSGNGAITVREGSGDRLEVRAVKNVRSGGSVSDVAFDVVESDGRIEICTLYDRQTSCRDRNGGGRNIRVRVDFTVLMPATSRLQVATGNGEINIDRAGADVSATTGNGDVTVGETNGRVDVTTGNGDVHVDGANGPVSVTTGNGKIFVLTSRGAVDANTGNGDVDVRIKSMPIERDMRFNSGSGAIRVSLPADFSGQIDASTGNGTLSTDFDIAVLGRLDAQHIRGTIGRGGPTIRMSTGNGQIVLRRS